MGTFAVPMWVIAAASAIVVFALFMAIRRAGGAALIRSLFRIAIVAAIVYAGWYYLQHQSGQDETAAKRSFDERSAALTARAIAPGSALACLDEMAGEAVEAACEKRVFGSPEAIAAAVSYVTAKLALLNESAEQANRPNGALAAELAPLRASIELDRFGVVAHVLETKNGCSADRCDALAKFKDPSHVLANIRDHVFQDRVTKYTAMWTSPTRSETPTIAIGPSAGIPTITPGPATVSPRYDFPSAKSIPAINIMAPEPTTPSHTQANAPAPATASETPVPPRRPAQARTTPPRPARERPAPAAQPDVDPADGTLPRTASPR